MKRIRKHVTFFSRQALLCVLLGGLVIGLASQERQITPRSKHSPPSVAAGETNSPAQKGMAGHQLPLPVSAAFIATAPVLPQQQTNGRNSCFEIRSVLGDDATPAPFPEQAARTSISLVSSTLGFRQSLVGARPSGTS